MTKVQELAEFAVRARWEDLSPAAQDALKIRVLDALGCALGAIGAPAVVAVRDHVEELGGNPYCTLIGGGRTAPDRAALYNAFLVRYLDFNDSYLAPGETCHPSDALGGLLAVAEHAGVSGADLLAGLAVSYQVQCRLSDEAPVRAKGFDHTVQLAYAVAAGAARCLGLSAEQAANAIAIAGTSLNALRVTRTGALSNWKGLAAPWAVAGAVQAALLARHGITGPSEVFEGNKGFEDLAGRFAIEWADLERVTRTIVKRYNAEIHSQSAIELLLELAPPAADVERIDLEVFDVAYHIIGGGEEGDKTVVRTKEEADHSLQYMLAVALLDGQVLPAQYRPERIVAADVQSLLRRVHVTPADDLSAAFPESHACRLRITLRDGRVIEGAKRDYFGFHTRPATWDSAAAKLASLAGDDMAELVDALSVLDRIPVRDLTTILEKGRAS
ncbi:MAG TPA: MmgE/PrpD family protein [Mycobacterium sp.]|nr:MmgE/PrpD family protein [Mycobacterium sp.]